MARAEVLVVTILVSPVKVVRVEPGVQVGLEDVGVVEDTNEAEKVEAEVATRARGRGRVGRCGLLMMFSFSRSKKSFFEIKYPKKYLSYSENVLNLEKVRKKFFVLMFLPVIPKFIINYRQPQDLRLPWKQFFHHNFLQPLYYPKIYGC